MDDSTEPIRSLGVSGYWSPQTWRRREGESVVTPFVAESLTKGGSYELRMGKEAFTTALGRRIVLTDHVVDVEIPPGQFALLLTKERVRVPVDSIGFISIKFSLKARGLINVSGFHVDPGYDGWLTFSVFNAGPNVITLSRDEPCFLLWLARWDEPLEANHLYPSGIIGARGSTERLQDSMVDNLKGEFSSPASLRKELEDLKAKQFKIVRWSSAVGALLVFVVGALVGAVISNVVDRALSTAEQVLTSPAPPTTTGSIQGVAPPTAAPSTDASKSQWTN